MRLLNNPSILSRLSIRPDTNVNNEFIFDLLLIPHHQAEYILASDAPDTALSLLPYAGERIERKKLIDCPSLQVIIFREQIVKQVDPVRMKNPFLFGSIWSNLGLYRPTKFKT